MKEELIPIRRALVSVSDKTGLVEFVKSLHSFGVEIISTGGTLKVLQAAKIPVKSISELTGFPEILDGRVKTLHPKVHGGLLFLRNNPDHKKTVDKEGIAPIDMVVVNLYPFEQVTSREGATLEEAIENIDIGGPSMLRSGAKNYRSVVVVCEPNDFSSLSRELKENKGSISASTSQKLALKVFERTSSYDRAIYSYLNGRSAASGQKNAPSTELPANISVELTQKGKLRYGENPHQAAALYQTKDAPTISFEQLHGKELSYNNLLDLDSALEILKEFKEPAACVIKHNNPCGLAQNKNLAAALDLAIDSDPLSAFGGIIGLNRTCTRKEVETIFKKLSFFEVILAPDFEEEALGELQKKKNLRILKIKKAAQQERCSLDFRHTQIGVLCQEKDPVISLTPEEARSEWKVVTKNKPNANDWSELLFAWKCAKLVKSNAIVLTRNQATVGIGAGQMSRVDSVEISCRKAGKRTKGSTLGSDAFFPMPDNIEIASQHGIKIIVQPGGSVKDQEVIDACDKHGITMVFTGERHFRH